MRRLLAPIVLSCLALLAGSADQPGNHTEQSAVYICDSPGATKYHLSSTCRGLNACDHDIIKVTKEEAIHKGKKTLCGWED